VHTRFAIPLRVALIGAVLCMATAAKPAKSPARPPGADTAVVRIGADDGNARAFVAWPLERTSAPAIVLVHDAWGLDEQVRTLARRLSREGYVTIVPDLYRGPVAADADAATTLGASLDREQANADLAAAVAWLRARPENAKSKLGVVGFGIGGALAQRFALGRSDVAAVVMFCGEPETDPAALSRSSAPLLAHFGATDTEVPAERADTLRRSLAAAHRTGDVYVYPGAGHAFTDEARPTYHGDATRQAWARTLAFLQRTLKS